jgi:hypothetical protein
VNCRAVSRLYNHVNPLAPEQARRYRRIHRAIWIAPLVAGGAWFLLTKLFGEPDTTGVVDRYPLLMLLPLVLLIVGPLLALTILELRVMHVVRPDIQTKKDVAKASWIRPIGFILAFEELVSAGEREYAEREHRRRVREHQRKASASSPKAG